MKYIDYDANQHNINRMIEVERQKINHFKMLNTIYKKKSFSLIKHQKQIDQQRSLRMHNQIIDKQRKLKQTQKSINYQNALLRNKLLQIYIPRQKQIHQSTLKTNQSFDTIFKQKNFGLNFQTNDQNQHKQTRLSNHNTSLSPSQIKRNQSKKQLQQTNAKFFVKLSNIRSDLMPKLKLDQHSRQSSYLKEMLMKKSPKKNIRMKRFVQRTISQRPKVYLPSTKSHREVTNTYESTNPQEPYIFY